MAMAKLLLAVDTRYTSASRVLMVENDLSLCDFLTDCLDAAGYEPMQAPDGLAGGRALAEREPQLASVDPGILRQAGVALVMPQQDRRVAGRFDGPQTLR